MNCGPMTDAQRERYEKRQREIAAMELTFIQIRMLPETMNCPPEERLG